MLRFVVGALHLLSLAVGVASNMVRIVALSRPLEPTDTGARRLLFTADNVAGLVAITWVGSGLWRAFGGLEKGSDYYLGNTFFQAKLAVLLAGSALEMLPMITFIKWRYAIRRGETPDDSRVPLIRRLLVGELVSTAAMIVCAVGMAQGLGATKPKGGLVTAEQVFRARCESCHGAQTQTMGLSLAQPNYAIGKRSAQWPDRTLVVAGDPDASLLVLKVRGTQADKGARMPPGASLDAEELAAVESWVAAAK